jgi:hypothetical protein
MPQFVQSSAVRDVNEGLAGLKELRSAPNSAARLRHVSDEHSKDRGDRKAQ